MPHFLALDQGTTSSRTLLFDGKFNVLSTSQQEFPQLFPRPGWVEHDPMAIWESQCATLKAVLRSKQGTHRGQPRLGEIAALGLTNQRETLVAWDKKTGKPLANAIVWQDRRTSEYCQSLKKKGHENRVRQKTGLLLDPYFSASKMHWLLQHNAAVKKAAKHERLAFGTIDSWLIYQLTRGRRHVTEVSNASRTLLMNWRSLDWDIDLLSLFGVPRSSLPDILDSDGEFGETDLPFLTGVPIRGVAGDQQAALFGHRCFEIGEAKNTYGTGCFLLRQIGHKPLPPPKGLLGTVAWKVGGQVSYAHEGAVMVGGAAIQFLRDGLGLLTHAAESEKLARQLPDSEGVVFVPAFAGLGTPHWDPDARGLIIGLTRGTTRAHLARAALESIAFQSHDLCQSFGKKGVQRLKVDGGATQNQFLMQFQADVSGIPVEVSRQPEMTALGAAMLASVGAKVYTVAQLRKWKWSSQVFRPKTAAKTRLAWLHRWNQAVNRAKGWASVG